MKNKTNTIINISVVFYIVLSFFLPRHVIANEHETIEEESYNWCFVIRTCEGCGRERHGGFQKVSAHATVGWESFQYSIHETTFDAMHARRFPSPPQCFTSRHQRHNIEVYLYKIERYTEKILCERQLNVEHGTRYIDIKVDMRNNDNYSCDVSP